MLNKKFALVLVLGIALVAFNGCSDDDDPVDPGGGGATVTFEVIDASGGYTGLEIRGSIADAATAMTQNGSLWTGEVSGFNSGDQTWEVWGDDGAKAMVQLGGPYDVTVGADGTVGGGTTEATVLPNGTVGGYVFSVIDEGSQYNKIMFKGSPTEDDWTPVDMVQNGTVWTHTMESIPEGSHEWGAIEDDGSEWGIWLATDGNLALTVEAGGAVAEGGEMTLVKPAPLPVVSLTLNVDMNAVAEISPLGVHVAGTFNDWTFTQLTDDDEDGVYSVVMEAEQSFDHEFKFLNGNAWGEGVQEIVPEECGVDDDFNAFNRIISVGTADLEYSAPFSGCPQ